MRPDGRDRAVPMTSTEVAARLAEHAWRLGRDHAAQGEIAEALRWLRRARRIAPRDSMVALTLATVLLQAGSFAEARALFAGLADTEDSADAWAGLAAATRSMGASGQAEAALDAALSTHAPTEAVGRLADRLVAEMGRPGWCGLDAAGRLHLHGQPDTVWLDGAVLDADAPLPEGWRLARRLSAVRDGTPFLGSPRPDRIARMEGVAAAAVGGGIEGWAWHPADPESDPLLHVVTASGTWTIRATMPDQGALPGRLAARPRRFSIEPGATEGIVRILDSTGRDLLGSPLDPGAERRAAAVLAHAAAGRAVAAPALAAVPVGEVGMRPGSRSRRAGVAVVVPVYRGLEQTMACLESVLDTVPDDARIIVVDDASPEPGLSAAVRTLARNARVRLIRHDLNQGFPAAANGSLRAAGRRDVVLLNSDTIVPPGWLDRLREAAYAAPDTGSATPLSNDATLASYPEPLSPAPDAERTRALDRIARRANGALTVEVPTGVGFCLYMRRDCLDAVGLFRDLVFAQGYGEENDWCLRARALGWRHVVAAGVFVAHVGGQSFGPAREHLMRRNLAALNRLHPGYDALIADFARADPLAAARRRMDALRWRELGRTAGAILVTHEGGGGVDRVIARRSTLLRDAGQRPIVLGVKSGQCRVMDGEGAYPNLGYSLPDDLPQLARLLRADRPTHVELHHLLGHDPTILDLAARLRIPYDVYIHDYAWFCPRISLMSYGRRYCGEPDVAGCEACVADLGRHLDEPIGVRDLLARSARVLAGARRIVAPSDDAARRLARHFTGLRPVVEPWERDPAPARPAIRPRERRRIAVVGAIGTQKGYDVLLACVRDAKARRLPLEFVVVGHTADDGRMLDAGPVFITGPYDEAEAVTLIRAQDADLAFLPSVWPETWCFALTRAWEAGLSVAAFDLGAQAERIRHTRRGWLLPLGLPASRVNAALLRPPQNVDTPLAPGALSLHSDGQESTARIS